MKKVILLASLALTLVACSDDQADRTIQQTPITPKPLPACQETVGLKLVWAGTDDENIAGYEMTIGTIPAKDGKCVGPASTFDRQFLNEDSPGITIPLDLRDICYTVSVTRTQQGGTVKSYWNQFYLPSCENRDQWQADHPTYEEPLEFRAVFK